MKKYRIRGINGVVFFHDKEEGEWWLVRRCETKEEALSLKEEKKFIIDHDGYLVTFCLKDLFILENDEISVFAKIEKVFPLKGEIRC